MSLMGENSICKKDSFELSVSNTNCFLVTFNMTLLVLLESVIALICRNEHTQCCKLSLP